MDHTLKMVPLLWLSTGVILKNARICYIAESAIFIQSKAKDWQSPTLLFHFPFARHRFQFLSCNTFARAYGSCFLNQPCCCHKLYFYARVFLLQLLEYEIRTSPLTSKCLKNATVSLVKHPRGNVQNLLRLRLVCIIGFPPFLPSFDPVSAGLLRVLRAWQLTAKTPYIRTWNRNQD